MSSAQDLFSLYAELAIALAGFVGVVSAFSGRDRVLRPIERVRLLHILGCSGSVLAACFAYFTVAAGGYSEARSFIAAAIGGFLVFACVALPLTGAVWHHVGDSDATTSPRVALLVTGINLLILLLFASTVASGGAGLPLFGCFSIELLLGLWLFARLLTRRN